MEVVVQMGLKAVMVGGQLIVKLFTVSDFLLFSEGDFAGDGRNQGKDERVAISYSCQTNCVPAAETEKG